MKKYLQFLLQPPVTRDFGKKLKHNFHTLTPGEMVLYFVFIRPFWSKERRFFFEGSFGLLGQMYSAERKALYDTVVTHKPRQCFEIGTYTGGGSTFFISAALKQNGIGTLYTSEIFPHYHQKAAKYYAQRLPKQNERITFIFSGDTSAFDPYVTRHERVDFVFFDGAEDGAETLAQYEYFKPYLKSGSVIAFHDWNTEKTRIIKSVIQSDSAWEQITELAPPLSVGMAVYKHR